MVTLDHVVFADWNACSLQSDISDVMLSARVVTTGNVNVQRLIHLNGFFEMAGNDHRVALGIGQSKLAAATAGAGYQSGAGAGCVPVQTHGFDSFFDCVDVGVVDSGDQQILPNRHPDVSLSKFIGNVGNLVKLFTSDAAHWKNQSDVLFARLFLRVKSDMGESVFDVFEFQFFIRHPFELRAQLCFDGF